MNVKKKHSNIIKHQGHIGKSQPALEDKEDTVWICFVYRFLVFNTVNQSCTCSKNSNYSAAISLFGLNCRGKITTQTQTQAGRWGNDRGAGMGGGEHELLLYL